MKTFEEIKAQGKNGEYYAIGDNGKQYEASFCTEYGNGGIMFFAIPSTVKILGYITRITAEQLKAEFLQEKAEIIAEAKAKGYYYPELETSGIFQDEQEEHYRTIGGLDYYFLKCRQLGITPKCIYSGLSYEAQGNGFSLDYCERDVILTISKQQNA